MRRRGGIGGAQPRGQDGAINSVRVPTTFVYRRHPARRICL